jgi:hypothetical protein
MFGTHIREAARVIGNWWDTRDSAIPMDYQHSLTGIAGLVVPTTTSDLIRSQSYTASNFVK